MTAARSLRDQPVRPLPAAPHAAAGGEIAAVCRLISVLGHAGFMDELAREYAALTGAAQVTTFFLEQQRARCALAYRPREPRLVESLCHSYTRNHFSRDPVLKAHLDSAGPGRDFTVRQLVSPEVYEDDYRARFFSSADLGGKMALISRRGERIVYVNFYFRAPVPTPPTEPDAAAALLAELLHKHDALTGGQFAAGTARTRAEAYLKDRFPELSPREAQECALIACGYSMAAIALELNVGQETAITFRKRAYAKLSISSRGELFAQCAGLAM